MIDLQGSVQPDKMSALSSSIWAASLEVDVCLGQVSMPVILPILLGTVDKIFSHLSLLRNMFQGGNL